MSMNMLEVLCAGWWRSQKMWLFRFKQYCAVGRQGKLALNFPLPQQADRISVNPKIKSYMDKHIITWRFIRIKWKVKGCVVYRAYLYKEEETYRIFLDHEWTQPQRHRYQGRNSLYYWTQTWMLVMQIQGHSCIFLPKNSTFRCNPMFYF